MVNHLKIRQTVLYNPFSDLISFLSGADISVIRQKGLFLLLKKRTFHCPALNYIGIFICNCSRHRFVIAGNITPYEDLDTKGFRGG